VAFRDAITLVSDYLTVFLDIAMGVPKLWDELQSAATVHSLTALACDAFKKNSNGKRGYRSVIAFSIHDRPCSVDSFKAGNRCFYLELSHGIWQGGRES